MTLRFALLVGASLTAAGCSGAASAPIGGTSADVVSTGGSATNQGSDVTAALVTKIRAAYALACQNRTDHVFEGQTESTPDVLVGEAAEKYAEYEQTTAAGLVSSGPPDVQVATVDGQTIYIVSGDLSDTGSEVGFYDAKGNCLALSYSGQGGHAGPDGVDWEK